ncbi:hypothetical protein MRX96_024919 [Rhipicephalus microplus]
MERKHEGGARDATLLQRRDHSQLCSQLFPNWKLGNASSPPPSTAQQSERSRCCATGLKHSPHQVFDLASAYVFEHFRECVRALRICSRQATIPALAASPRQNFLKSFLSYSS